MLGKTIDFFKEAMRLNRRKTVLILLLVGCLVLGAAAYAGSPAEETRMQMAVDWLQCVFEGRLKEAEEQLDDAMRTALGAQGGLAAVANALKAYGDVSAYGEATAVVASGYLVVMVPVTFEKERMNAQISVTVDGKIGGLYFLPAQDDADIALAMEVLNMIFEGDYENAEAHYAAKMKEAIAQSGGMQAVMEAVLASTGPVLEIGTATKTPSQGMQVVVVPLVFAEGTLHAYITLDDDRMVAGLQFMQPAVVADAVIPEGAAEEEVTVDAGTGYPLGGTLCAPASDTALPAVLLVSGSGRNARDEIAGANRMFAQVAHGLAERGIITLRFDKRTHTYPEQWDAPGFTVVQEYVEDVLAALDVLKADPRVDPERVYIAGHSQGGMLAPRFVASGAEAAGLILMAGSPRNLSDILYDQEMNALAENDQLTEAQRATYAALYEDWRAEALAVYAMTDAEALAHDALYDGAFPAYYLYEMQKHDALALLTAQKTPVLVLQGRNDMQVYADVDYALYEEALSGERYAELKLYEGLNHMFMPSTAADITEAMLEYNEPAEIPAEVLDDIAAFVTASR